MKDTSISMPGNSKQVLLLGLTGSTSSGKTTLCALLSQILPPPPPPPPPSSSNPTSAPEQPHLLFLHCDAYSKDFPELPVHPTGVLNAESRDSIHIDKLISAFDEIKTTGSSPMSGYESFDFIEHDLARARKRLPEEFVEEMRGAVTMAAIDWDRFGAVCVVDGFMLYPIPEMRERLDGGIFQRVSKGEARRRRLGRYEGSAIAPDEFWKTEGYFEDVVWPEFVKEHGFLFPNEDVEADLDGFALAELRERYRLSVAPKVDMGLEDSLRWATTKILETISLTQTPQS